MLLEHLVDCAAMPDSPVGKDSLPHSLFLSDASHRVLQPQVLWNRLTTLHLLAIKLQAHGARSPDAFVVAGSPVLYTSLRKEQGGWCPLHDFFLVKGIMTYG